MICLRDAYISNVWEARVVTFNGLIYSLKHRKESKQTELEYQFMKVKGPRK